MNRPSQQPLPTNLPPPPAPVARDANPWLWPQGAGERPGSRRLKSPYPKLEQIQRLRQAAANATSSPPPSPAAAVPEAPSAATARKRNNGRDGLAAIVPFGMFLVAMGIVASGALDALRDGAGLGAFIPLLVIALIFGLGALRRARRGERD